MWYGLLAAFAGQGVIMTIAVMLVINMPWEAERAQKRLADQYIAAMTGDAGHSQTLTAPLVANG